MSEKYGGEAQVPLMGAGGMGRQVRLSRPSYSSEGEELLWTQDVASNGGHNVPLSSKSVLCPAPVRFIDVLFRLHERSVLRDHRPR